MAVHIKKIDFSNTWLRGAVAVLLAGALLGLYHGFRQLPEAISPTPAPPEPGNDAPPTPTSPPTEPERHDERMKLRLPPDVLAGEHTPGTTAPSMEKSTGTQFDRDPLTRAPAASADLALGVNAELTTTPVKPSAIPATPATTPLHLPPVDSEPALDASQKLATAPPATPRPQPEDPAPKDHAPVLPPPERNGPRRPATLAEHQPPQSSTLPDAGSSVTSRLGAFGWTVPPIRWGGQIGLQIGQNHNDSGLTTSSISEFLNLNASSYVYQPWFARINGHLSLNASQEKSSGGSQPNSSNNTRAVSGGGALNLFPLSRFPALVTYDVTNSNSVSNPTGTDSTSTRFGVSQSYRPVSGAYNMSGGYNHSTFSSSNQSNDTVNALFGNFSTRFGDQSLSTTANYSKSSNDAGQGSSLLNLSATHNFRVRDNLLIDSLATLNDNTQNFTAGTALSETHGRVMQLNSNVNWHPEEDDDGNIIPLNVNAGARATSFQNESNASSASTQSLSANIGANYSYNRNLSLNGNGLVTRISGNNAESQVFTLLGAGANYNGDPRSFGGFSYNWNTGANGTQQTGGNTASNLTLSGQLGHSLNRAITLSETSSMSTSIGQSASHTTNSLTGSSSTLTHIASASLSTQFSERTHGSTNLIFSDTITTGTNSSHITNIKLSSQGNMQITSRSSGNINMSVERQISSSVLDGANEKTATTNVFGSANYLHRQAFGVPRLSFNSSLNVNTRLLSNDARLAGDVNASNQDTTYAFDNRFDYRIGLLNFQLQGTVNSTSGLQNFAVFFRVTRELGGF